MNKPNDRPAEDCRQECGYQNGRLPACAPLAGAYTPMQCQAEPRYEPDEALARGTLFPGLDLPWKNVVNQTPQQTTPLDELMALGFVVNELGLYLDTHAGDTEALALFRRYAALYKEGEKRYAERFGPVRRLQAVGEGERWAWLAEPWPWEYREGRNG